jgi:chromosome segregation ATPase
MIFMLTMIVVIVKNANLAKELTVSQSEAQNLQSLLEETRTDREALKIEITNLEEKLRAQQMEIILLGDENKVVQSTLEAKVALISALQKQLSEIQADAEKLASRLTTAEAEKEALASRYEEQMKAISAETERQIEEFNRKFAALMDRLGEKEDLIVALNTEKKDLELTLAKQRKAYLVLEDKYQRLIRPARSPLGKEVVTVQYSRQDGQYRILYKEPQSDEFEPVGREELQTRLDRLKSRWQDKLYIKIVIPEQSGLSYNEAWNFTRDILSRYDYYYQDRNHSESLDKATLPGGL